jgi:hypothetical protein
MRIRVTLTGFLHDDTFPAVPSTAIPAQSAEPQCTASRP